MADPAPRDSTPPPNTSASSSMTPRRTPGRAAASPRTATPSRKRAAEASSTHASPAAKRAAVATAASTVADDDDEKAVEESMDLDDPSMASTSTAGPPRAVHVDERRIRPAAFVDYSAFMDDLGVPAAPAESSSAPPKSPAPVAAQKAIPSVAAQPPARADADAAQMKEAPVMAEGDSGPSTGHMGGDEQSAPSAATATVQAQQTETAAPSVSQPPVSPARPAPPTVTTATPTRTSPRTPRVAQPAITPSKTPSRAAAGPSTTPGAPTPAAGPSTTPSTSSRSREAAVDQASEPAAGRATTPGPSSTPAATPAAPADVAAAAVAPQAKTPRSRRSAAHTAESNRILSAPIEPIETEGGEAEQPPDTSEWGKRWEITQNAIDLAVRAATQRWTVRDMETCFPRLAKQNPRGLQDVYINVVHSMRTKILEQKDEVFEKYNVVEALRMIDEVANDAKAHAAKNQGPRPDAWRADLSPQAMTAATNLMLYDLTWDRLRTEYENLHADIAARCKSLSEKQAQLLETEGSVAEGVVDLEKTIKLMDHCPTPEMTAWMEKVSGTLEGARRP